MATVFAKNAGNSGTEEKFIQLFCEVFGPEKGQFVYLQYPFLDIYGGHRTIDFAINTAEGRIAIEVDGNTWHDPSKVSEDKYHDDLLKQNTAMMHEEQEKVKVESWDKIFDITPMEDEWNINGKYIQANFWELKPEYVVSVRHIKQQKMKNHCKTENEVEGGSLCIAQKARS